MSRRRKTKDFKKTRENKDPRATDYENIYQFKITLEGTENPIWRRIQVPESYSFWDLHVAIQDAMGWEDYHQHEFRIKTPGKEEMTVIGIPDRSYKRFGIKVLPDWNMKITKYFSMEHPFADYQYDFGDSWDHEILLEEILPVDKNYDYPRCIDGTGACPPEDCGGFLGYNTILKALREPENKKFKDLLLSLGKDFDPEKFDKNKIVFDDPVARLRGFFK
jgi:hypothetical protein